MLSITDIPGPGDAGLDEDSPDLKDPQHDPSHPAKVPEGEPDVEPDSGVDDPQYPPFNP
ncbi:hypothetical protein [Pseudomonas sp. dw_358]|uniref:hypothetical protein n=1 Tax=Pseudomonas sp. dw_358 TaxID=2720083 RepID=UPI001BD30709|nr:hypothetical protein [Pseudomonas sp. dw_358]